MTGQVANGGNIVPDPMFFFNYALKCYNEILGKWVVFLMLRTFCVLDVVRGIGARWAAMAGK